MSTAPVVTAEMETQQEQRTGAGGTPAELVLGLGPWYSNAPTEQLAPVLAHLREALGLRVERCIVAYPVSDPQAESSQHEGIVLQPYLPVSKQQSLSVQTAASYLSVYEVVRAHSAKCALLLGAEGQSLRPSAIRDMVEAVLDRGADLALPRYATASNEGLINTSLLYPLTRAVYGVRARFPLALDLAMSNRMAERMAGAAQRCTANAQPEGLVWPCAEAAVANFTVAEVDAGHRDLPHPDGSDLSTILSTIAGSLFSDVEAKATYWQRSRPATALMKIGNEQPETTAAEEPVAPEEIEDLIRNFRLGYGNLHEIWSLVLPPHTLLGLKRLSVAPPETFALPDALWVRIVYDFVLAHRLRTLNRGHLLGSLTPLYLAWVASHIQANTPENAESLAKAFEADKPYLVSRWRWPDRFNP